MMHRVMSPFHAGFTWGKNAVAWVGRNAVYLFEIFVGVIVISGEQSLLSSAGETFMRLSGYPWRCLLPLSPSLCAVSAPLSWLGLLLLVVYLILILVGLVAFPLAAFLIARDGVGRIRAWSRDPNRQAMLQLRRQRAELALLLVNAQEENEYASYWEENSFTSTQAPGTHPISRFAGIWPFYYVTLSNYLRLPPAPTEEHGNGPHQAAAATPEKAAYIVRLFSKPRLWVEGTKTVEVPLTLRQQEVMSYLGTVGREKGCSGETIIAAVHERRVAQRKVTSHRDALDYDVREIRRSVEAACQRVEVPYINPVDVSGRGPGTFYHLALAYEVMDITQFDRLVERMEQLKHEPHLVKNMQEFRKTYESMLTSYGSGFLGQQVQEKYTGPWAVAYYFQYQSKYHQLLWNIAEYEYTRSQEQQGEEKKASLRQAVKLYEQCALLTAPTRKEDLQQGDLARLSEHALRQALMMYRLLDDLSLARQFYYHYIRTLQRRSRGWQPEPQTVQVFDAVMGASRQEPQENTPPTNTGENDGGRYSS